MFLKIFSQPKFYAQILNIKPDICFNALHGSFGEDGTIQSFLNKIKIPYTHSGSSTSCLAMNKLLTKHFLTVSTKENAVPLYRNTLTLDANEMRY